MSLIYGIGIPPEIIPDSTTIDAAQQFANSLVPTSAFDPSYLARLTNLDFSNYDDRRLLLRTLLPLPFGITPPCHTASFDPIQFPLFPPFQQRRFASPGTFYSLTTAPFVQIYTDFRTALSYRDGDPDYTALSQLYSSALSRLLLALSDPTVVVDRLSFELRFLLAFSIWPIPIPP
jgi:hypothetical protein